MLETFKTRRNIGQQAMKTIGRLLQKTPLNSSEGQTRSSQCIGIFHPSYQTLSARHRFFQTNAQINISNCYIEISTI